MEKRRQEIVKIPSNKPTSDKMQELLKATFEEEFPEQEGMDISPMDMSAALGFLHYARERDKTPLREVVLTGSEMTAEDADGIRDYISLQKFKKSLERDGFAQEDIDTIMEVYQRHLERNRTEEEAN